jgi:hypothetical protein
MGLHLRTAQDADSQWRDVWSLRTPYEGALFFVARQTFASLETTSMTTRKKGDYRGKESG